MKVASLLYKNSSFVKERNLENINYKDVSLVIGFGASVLVQDYSVFEAIRCKFPYAQIVLSSSAGEIYEEEVFDDSISVTAIVMEKTRIQTAQVDSTEFSSSYDAGKALMEKLNVPNLKYVFVLSDGGLVNGSELVKGINESKSEEILVTGGLAGDGTKFEKTFVGLNAIPSTGKIVAIGFYGNQLVVSHGSMGGWETFGLERKVTKSNKNILFEIEGKNALSLYKTYLGKYAEELPGSALLFPLSLVIESSNETVVRTILSINEVEQSMTFAGDIPEGSKVRFMRANFDKLIHAASDAANNCLYVKDTIPKLALLVSCVGRKIILGNRIEEEVEAVKDIFGPETTITGFYSYGEISPIKTTINCELHNQTMTITGINELD